MAATNSAQQIDQQPSKRFLIFRFAFLSLLSHLLLISFFAFLMFRFKVNIVIVAVGFLVAFWVQILTLRYTSPRPFVKLRARGGTQGERE